MNVRLKDELLSRGYEYRELKLDHTYRQYFFDDRLIITKASYYDFPFVSKTAKTISLNKSLAYAFAEQHAIRIPATIQTIDPDRLADFLHLHKRVIVKPAELGGGTGLTTDITTEAALFSAINKAGRPSAAPLIQQQFEGEEIRLTVLNGSVRSAIYRQSPSITGDGHSSVRELIDAENLQRKGLAFPLLAYPQLTRELIDETLFSDTTVLAPGRRKRLSSASMIRHGASFYDVLDTVHPSYIRLAEQLARDLNPPFLVVDFMVKDHTAAAERDNYIFLEFNTAPALEVYSSLRGGDNSYMIGEIADLVDKYTHAYE